MPAFPEASFVQATNERLERARRVRSRWIFRSTSGISWPDSGQIYTTSCLCQDNVNNLLLSPINEDRGPNLVADMMITFTRHSKSGASDEQIASGSDLKHE